ncbi:MAG TPA: hypothetical protein VMV56_09950 [Williamwhitmania sp.]|nr:hypothetical protein [Williamwhitmania sp.]
MNKIQYGQGSGTFSQVLIVGLGVVIGSHFIQGVNLSDDAAQVRKAVLQKSYSADGNSPSYNSYASIFTGQYSATSKGFEETVGGLYARLLNNQEPLGAEFEKVLNENLWDLYES